MVSWRRTKGPAVTDIPNHNPSAGYRLTDRYHRTQGTAFLTGIQALARIPI